VDPNVEYEAYLKQAPLKPEKTVKPEIEPALTG
jgi:hypothetical protein